MGILIYPQAIAWSTMVVAISALTGCVDKEKTEIPVAAVELPKAEAKKYTAADWKRNFTSTFKESEKKVDGDGMTSYYACFDQESESKKCAEKYSSYRDGFKKVDYMTPVTTSFHGLGEINSLVNMYIAAIECRDAKAVLQPSFNGDNGWLFMKKVAFMADGEVVFEKSADPSEVKRDNESRWVHEKWTFALSKDDEKSLMKFSESESRIIRLTGDKGYVTIKKSELDAFTKDIRQLIKNTNQINDAMKTDGGPNCTETPIQPT